MDAMRSIWSVWEKSPSEIRSARNVLLRELVTLASAPTDPQQADLEPWIQKARATWPCAHCFESPIPDYVSCSDRLLLDALREHPNIAQANRYDWPWLPSGIVLTDFHAVVPPAVLEAMLGACAAGRLSPEVARGALALISERTAIPISCVHFFKENEEGDEDVEWATVDFSAEEAFAYKWATRDIPPLACKRLNHAYRSIMDARVLTRDDPYVDPLVADGLEERFHQRCQPDPHWRDE